jgi:hypothetical protein
MPQIDFNCTHCSSFAPTNAEQSDHWVCTRYQKQIDRGDPDWCVCRVWRPAQGRFPSELLSYFTEVAPGALNHLKTRELYRTSPECELMPLS